MKPIICGQEGVVVGDHLDRDPARPQDLLAVVDVVQERVDRPHPLLDAPLEPGPFPGRDDARDDVERDEPLVALLAAVDVEGDAGAPEQRLGIGRLLQQPARVLLGEPLVVVPVGRPQRGAVAVHLVEMAGANIHGVNLSNPGAHGFASETNR